MALSYEKSLNWFIPVNLSFLKWIKDKKMSKGSFSLLKVQQTKYKNKQKKKKKRHKTKT